MRKLDPLIEGYLSYLADVGRKTPRTVIDVRCTFGVWSKGCERVIPRLRCGT